ncbi:MAG: hypothetical protein WCR07_04065 [Verrucomicrobiota bacterium]|jgi:hypothetical protein
MDKDLRNLLFGTTQAIRRLLEEEFSLQLEGTFDVHADGRVAEQPGSQLSATERLVRGRIVEAIQHRLAVGESAAEAVRGFQSEAVFTFLNRLAALKMMEARALVLPCVSQGDQSQGFKEFSGLAPGLIELPDKGYRLYLECLFDEIGREVGVLFDRTDAASQLWPRRKALESVLAKLNTPELAGVWAEDETIGWIYQYYNDPEERALMRDTKRGGSAAPRNSREMAVRNQFFTPRYVVEFLTDNALGRLWYEMTRGETHLKERCRYLVRRPNEVFLPPGKNPEPLPQEADLSQQPIQIPHRSIKDPRTFLMIDPACGSMHFGLYAFDLFEVIYQEAWELEEKAGTEALARSEGMKPLHEGYPTKEAFLRDVPRLILEHNIHGIDIDPRAAQIAGLALWLRAQKSWQRLGLKPADRPAVRRSNIVCAEPMPGERDLLREFVQQHFPAPERALFLSFLENVWEKMRLAGEAGSLLQIEEEIRELVATAKQQWKDRPKAEQIDMFPGMAPIPAQTEMRLDVSGITDEQFWEKVEERVYSALRTFAERSESVGGFQRRLFAEDAARGFAFIDLCRERYDVALMNPPFGDASLPSKSYLDDTYGDTKGDVYKAFVECFQARLVPAGYLGIISSRTGFFLSGSEDWRTRVVLRLYRPIALADLGSGVLDAMVEVSAYVLRRLSATEARDLTLSLVPVLEKVVRDSQDRFSLPKWQAARGGLKRHQAVAELDHLESYGFIQRSPGDLVRYSPLWHAVKKVTAPPNPVYPPLVCVRALADEDKAHAIRDQVVTPSAQATFICNPASFAEVPGSPFSYWTGPRTRDLFRQFDQFENDDRVARLGMNTADNFRFVRVTWEVPHFARSDAWVPFVKGGAYARFYADVPLLVSWENDGCEMKAWIETLPGCSHWSRRIASAEYYFKPGLTWPLRTASFSPQAMPAGCIFSVRGYAILASPKELPSLLAFCASSAFDYLFKVMLGRFGFPEFVVGILQKLPMPTLSDESKRQLGTLSQLSWETKRSLDTANLTSKAFHLPALLATPGPLLAERAAAWAVRVRTGEETVAATQAEIDDLAIRIYGLDATDRAALTSTLVTEATGDATADADEREEEEATAADETALTADLVAYALGCAFGRWDIRFATGERPPPEPPDPFAPLPVCPPGQLQNAQGLPAGPEDVPADYPVHIPWDGILVDDENHPRDAVERVREVLHILWKERAETIEQEACEILEVKSLRNWIRKPICFFDDHLTRYTKSKRKAPIYWPLSSPGGLYTIWLYYHRLTADTLFTVLRDYLKPKLEFEERRAFQLRQEAGTTPSPSQRRDIAEAEELVEDLRAFKAELERVAPLFRPNLNDGVIINYAPLWRMIGLPKWRKDCQAIWNELAKGDYDWAHLALHLWPERVVPKCATDRSLAIAHGLESAFWQEDPEKPGKWIARQVTDTEVRGLIAERTSAAVKAAVESLVGATSNEGAPRRGRKGAKA